MPSLWVVGLSLRVHVPDHDHRSFPAGAWVMVKVKSLSSVRLFVTPWTVACQAPRSKK